VSSIPRGSLGGYRHLSNMINNHEVDMLVCLGNPEKTNNFQTGISDLIALAVEKNIMLACNETTSDILLRAIYHKPIVAGGESPLNHMAVLADELQDSATYGALVGNLPTMNSGARNN
jgi:hypothetical protein